VPPPEQSHDWVESGVQLMDAHPVQVPQLLPSLLQL
jgi:hypothetical protein